MDNRTGGPNHATDDAMATVVFVDLAGFSAIADVFGDAAAIGVLDLFETLVRDSVGEDGKLVKWIGDEAMLLFPEPDLALQALSRLLPACRAEKRIPLTRCGLNHGPVVRRGNDVFGSTVNIASRITALAAPGQLVATRPIAEVAKARADKGVVFYAIDEEEEPADVKPFLEKLKLADLKVPMDKDGVAAQAYLVDALPQTVIIGKDGVIKSVHVGLKSKEDFAKAVDAALGQK